MKTSSLKLNDIPTHLSQQFHCPTNGTSHESSAQNQWIYNRYMAFQLEDPSNNYFSSYIPAITKSIPQSQLEPELSGDRY
jgi:hypothetical protein